LGEGANEREKREATSKSKKKTSSSGLGAKIPEAKQPSFDPIASKTTKRGGGRRPYPDESSRPQFCLETQNALNGKKRGEKTRNS